MPYILTSSPTAEPVSLTEAKLHLRVDINDDDALISSMISAARMHAEMVTQRQLVAAGWKLVMDAFPGPSLIGVPFGVPLSLPGHAVLLNKSTVLDVSSIKYTDMAGIQQTMPATDYIAELSTEPARITPVFGKIWPIPLPQIGAVEVNFVSGYATPITADATANTITVSRWKTLAVGDVVRFSNTGGALPAPLATLTDYYIQSVVSPGVYTLSLTSGGAAIDLTTAGTGTSFLGEIPEGIRQWIKIRVNTMYENREQFVLAGRGTHVEPMPFVDGLLDPYRVVTY